MPEHSVESSDYTWVELWNTLGLGENLLTATGNLFDGFRVLAYSSYVTLRAPCPMGFCAKRLDDRIDDPSTGWKGRGLWSANGHRPPWQMEGGKGTKPPVVHIRMRPDPLVH